VRIFAPKKKENVMRKPYLIGLAAILIVSASILIAGCSNARAQDKMPITTSSEEAMKSYLQGRELVEKLRGQESRQYFQKATEEDPDFAVAHLQLAGVQPSAKAFFESFNRAKALVDKVSNAEQLWIRGFEAGGIAGDPMRQRELYKELVEAFPNDERARNLLATNYFGQQEWALAVEEYERAAEIDPEFSPIYNQMGYALRFLERYDEAVSVFEKYIELIPEDPNPYDSHAELLMKMGRYDESIEQYEAALKVRSDFVFSHVGIASNLNFKDQHGEARKQLQIMYDNAKDDGQRRAALTAMAFSFIDEGDFDQALEQYQKLYAIAEAIGDSSAMAGDLALMGFALVEVEGREKEALHKFEQATKMVQASSLSDKTKEQNRLGHFYNAGRAFVAMGNVEEAKTNASEYRKLVQAARNPNQIKASHQLDGLIALEEGKFDFAIEELMQSNLQNAYNHFFIGKAYEGKGDRDQARSHYDKAANFNALNNSPQACIRAKAAKLAATI
jgi:tetratricopeptide (TPR) repeat protein